MAFREDEHPRDESGKFTGKEGGAKSKTEKLREAVNIYSDDPVKDVRYRQNASYEDILKTGKPKLEKATGFNRLETKHHKRHAKEMGFKNTKEYEKAAVEFFNSDRGELSYSRSRKRWYRYDKGSGYFASSSDGIVHTFYRLAEKKFRMKEKQDECIKY